MSQEKRKYKTLSIETVEHGGFVVSSHGVNQFELLIATSTLKEALQFVEDNIAGNTDAIP